MVRIGGIKHRAAGFTSRNKSLTGLMAIVFVWGLVSPAFADSPCGTLAVGFDGHWFRGGSQLRADTEGIRAFVRTYNPSVAYDVSAWVMLARNGPSPGYVDDGWAQAGWTKERWSVRDPYNPVWFLQIKRPNGSYDTKYFLNGTSWAIYPPTVYQYQVTTDRNFTWRFYFDGVQRFTYYPSDGFGNWQPLENQVFAEVQKSYGDQLPGDTSQPNTKVSFRNVNFATGGVWYGSSLGGAVPAVYDPDTPSPIGRDTNNSHGWYDKLFAYSGSDFDIWDARCP